MSSILSELSGTIGGVVGGTRHWVADQWTQRVVQVSVYAAIVFFLLSHYSLIEVVEKNVWSMVGVKLGKEGTLALHAVIFMYVGSRFILDPMLGRVVEGNDGDFEHIDQDTANKMDKLAQECNESDDACLKGFQDLLSDTECKSYANNMKVDEAKKYLGARKILATLIQTCHK